MTNSILPDYGTALPPAPTAPSVGGKRRPVKLVEHPAFRPYRGRAAARPPSAGLRIPEDLSVIGFDDIPAAEWIEPGLTTIRQPVVQMAETAMRALLRHLDGDEELPQRIELGTELVVRGSTAPPAKK